MTTATVVLRPDTHLRGNLCYVCGLDLSLILHTHHIRPKAAGGSESRVNKVHLCPTCHALIHLLRHLRNVPFDPTTNLEEEMDAAALFQNVGTWVKSYFGAAAQERLLDLMSKNAGSRNKSNAQ